LGFAYAGGVVVPLEVLAISAVGSSSPFEGGKGDVLIPSKIFRSFLRKLHSGKVAQGKLDIPLWKKTFTELFTAFEAGYGETLASVKYNTTDYAFLKELKYNTAVFSAFKQNEQIKDAAKLLLKEDGSARTWKEFRSAAMEIDDTYNKRWLQTEFNQAQNAALQARRWNDAVKTADLYPNMEYIAVQDERTRASHMKLHGTILPITDPFWNTYTPPIDWGCRCTLRRTDADPTSVPGDIPGVAEGMDVNTGKDAKIFSDNHPYVTGSADQATAIKEFVNSQLG
jgi:SPP1 gp7 family putative phage head morphogenesis protein